MTDAASACDLVLEGGTIVDGTGAPAFRADVAVRGDRILAVGTAAGFEARRRIRVNGLVVSPGFIDAHAHDDAIVAEQPAMLPKITQGVTTVISGNCGISGAPFPPGAPIPDLLRLLFKRDIALAGGMAELFALVEQAAPAVNAAFLTGHTTLRAAVMGDDLDRSATPEEAAEMHRLLAGCVAAGSLGLSTGLFYPPARHASTAEIVEITRDLGAAGGIYVTHLRDEGDHVLESLEEALHIGRAADCPVVISHHKCLGERNFGRSRETLALLARAQAGQPVGLDVYPYTAGSSVLLAELAEAAARTVITWSDTQPQFAGWDLERVAAELGCDPLSAVRLLQPAGALYFMMDEADVRRIMQFPQTMIGSDGLPADVRPHPRLWGTFPRVLGRYVREEPVLALEDAVHRMTGLTAARFSLADRGLVRPGAFADLCVFDPDRVIDRADYHNPTTPSVGIVHVVVNGVMAIEQGVPTGDRAGRVLRRPGAVEPENRP
jgi:N-acyl-D-amino-acid deacylase